MAQPLGIIIPIPSTTTASPSQTPSAALFSANSTAAFPHSQASSDFDDESAPAIDQADEFVELNAISSSAGGGKKSTAKLTSDAKWTSTMEEKLVERVMAEKAYIKTDVTMSKKFDIVKSKLILDREFMVIAGMAEKTGQAFEKKFKSLLKSFRIRHALDVEGANIGGLGGDTMANMNRFDKNLYAISKEIEASFEKRRVVMEKENQRNKSMLAREATGLTGRSFAQPPTSEAEAAVADSPSDDLTSSSKEGPADSRFISRHGQSSAEIALAEATLKLQEAKNEGLRLQIQLEQLRQAREHRQGYREVLEQNRQLMAQLICDSSSKKRKLDRSDEDRVKGEGEGERERGGEGEGEVEDV